MHVGLRLEVELGLLEGLRDHLGVATAEDNEVSAVSAVAGVRQTLREDLLQGLSAAHTVSGFLNDVLVKSALNDVHELARVVHRQSSFDGLC